MQYRYISGDSHLEIDSKHWLARVPEKYRDQAPRLVRQPHGGDAWLIGDKIKRPAAAADLYGGKGRDEYLPFDGKYEGTPGTGSPRLSASANRTETASTPRCCFHRSKAGRSFGAASKITTPIGPSCARTTVGSPTNTAPPIPSVCSASAFCRSPVTWTMSSPRWSIAKKLVSKRCCSRISQRQRLSVGC